MIVIDTSLRIELLNFYVHIFAIQFERLGVDGLPGYRPIARSLVVSVLVGVGKEGVAEWNVLGGVGDCVVYVELMLLLRQAVVHLLSLAFDCRRLTGGKAFLISRDNAGPLLD